MSTTKQVYEMADWVQQEDQKLYWTSMAPSTCKEHVRILMPEQFPEATKEELDHAFEIAQAEGKVRIGGADLTIFNDEELLELRAKQVEDKALDAAWKAQLARGGRVKSADEIIDDFEYCAFLDHKDAVAKAYQERKAAAGADWDDGIPL